MSKSTWILIFTKVQLILDELFTIFTTNVVQHVKIYLDINFHEERILSTLAKNVVQHVKIYLDINFHEERILSTLAKVNRLLILIESCSSCQNLLGY
ncbi:uncharacterized protein OCT59_001648 [Rhizophagus irregularis]|uniref:uncharacterized protein n=1 Tax=Rhizophagus irregularis TaxID=588596 RepID=UPI003317FD29|nr:hypothetical protein OCT59_001648 [Rhizophagus irregularis]